MSHLIHRWKQLVLSFCVIASLICCKKPQIDKDSETSRPQAISIYEPITDIHGQSHCGSVFTTELKVEDATTVGSVDVSNDSQYLYLTYSLNDDWYLLGVQSFAGAKTNIPLTPRGNPNHEQFPGKETINPCNLLQSFTFKVPLSEIESDGNSQCPSNVQYFIAMRATIKQITNGSNCTTGTPVEAWAAPVLINPGDASEWATAFYYCKQECKPQTNSQSSQSTPTTWCAFGQGYWFAKPNVIWCQDYVKYGNLTVSKDDARALWPAQNNVAKKAFFQASALQLSMICNNNNAAIPQAIASDYSTLVALLGRLTYDDIKNGVVPAGVDATSIQTAAGNVGKWICQNNCNPSIDPTNCQ